MKTKTKEQLIYESILNDKVIHNLQYLKYKIYQSLPYTLILDLDRVTFESSNINDNLSIQELNHQISFRIKQ